MITLPIDSLLPEVLETLRSSRSLVLVAPPGAGKTTRVPPAILRSGQLSADHPNLILLQPRRIAARAVARRMADENGWTLGDEVGYHIRFERRIGLHTRLRVQTEGILTRQLLADAFLPGVGAVILDEFHERSLHTDLAIALLREVRDTVRPDLIVVVMSATLDADPIARFLGRCAVLRSPGRMFPVTIEYQPSRDREPMHEQVVRAVARELGPNERGDILVFLPGMEEIRRAGKALQPIAAAEGVLVLPLHGSLSEEDQDRALRPAPVRKVVLATNVAETSLTIEGVRTVIDTGWARYAGHDPVRGLDRLELGRISRSSAEQRTGRAGRTGPGRCVRLWSPRDERRMSDHDAPEIRRVDLSECVLALHAWGHADPARFGWYEIPPEPAIAGALAVLTLLGAREPESGRITELGRRLLGLPIHPRLGRLILGAALVHRLFEGATLAALLAEKDLALVPMHPDERRRSDRARVSGESDLLIRLDWLEEAEQCRFAPALRERGIDPAAARRVAAARDELFRLGRRLPGMRHAERRRLDDERPLLKLALLAYPDRVARRRQADPSTAVMVGGRPIQLGCESVVREPELFLALDPREDRRGGSPTTRVRIASAIRAEWLQECFPNFIRREHEVRFDESRGRVVGVDTTWYRDLPIREEPHVRVDPAEATLALAAAVHARATDFFLADEAASAWLTRLRCLQTWMPERSWREYTAADLAGLLELACHGRRSLEELRQVPLVPLLQGLLTRQEARALDELAPESLTVPSGSRYRLSYELGRPPSLAVRLQELFGWRVTPRIAAGRVAVVLHLLGPNYRPVQITGDLESFWSTTYFQVRKDLRARYPKHAWPEDPLEAKPVSKRPPRS